MTTIFQGTATQITSSSQTLLLVVMICF